MNFIKLLQNKTCQIPESIAVKVYQPSSEPLAWPKSSFAHARRMLWRKPYILPVTVDSLIRKWHRCILVAFHQAEKPNVLVKNYWVIHGSRGGYLAMIRHAAMQEKQSTSPHEKRKLQYECRDSAWRRRLAATCRSGGIGHCAHAHAAQFCAIKSALSLFWL